MENSSENIMRKIPDNPASGMGPVLAWFVRPATLAVFLVTNLFILYNHLRHRALVLMILQEWKSSTGFRCGTGMTMDETAMFIATLLVPIPLGIGYLGWTGISSHLRKDASNADGTLRGFLLQVNPWQRASELWVLWLVVVNAVLFFALTPEGGEGYEFLEFFLPLAFCFITGWLGVAAPAVIARNLAGTWCGILSAVLLVLGCAAAMPLLFLGMSLDQFSSVVRSPMNLFEVCVWFAAGYLVAMMFLLPLWLRVLVKGRCGQT